MCMLVASTLFLRDLCQQAIRQQCAAHLQASGICLLCKEAPATMRNPIDPFTQLEDNRWEGDRTTLGALTERATKLSAW